MTYNDPAGTTQGFPRDLNELSADVAPASPDTAPTEHPERIGRYRIEKVFRCVEPRPREDVILRTNIDELVSTGVSLMPEGLEKDLSRQDLADVLSFVKTIKPK